MPPTFAQLQAECKARQLGPCAGRGITKAVLQQKLLARSAKSPAAASTTLRSDVVYAAKEGDAKPRIVVGERVAALRTVDVDDDRWACVRGSYNRVTRKVWRGRRIVVRQSLCPSPSALAELRLTLHAAAAGVGPEVLRAGTDARGRAVYWLEAGTPLDETKQWTTRALLAALERAARAGLVLLDLKPANAVVVGSRVRLIDYDPQFTLGGVGYRCALYLNTLLFAVHLRCKGRRPDVFAALRRRLLATPPPRADAVCAALLQRDRATTAGLARAVVRGLRRVVEHYFVPCVTKKLTHDRPVVEQLAAWL